MAMVYKYTGILTVGVLLFKSRRLPFSGFLPLDVSSLAMGVVAVGVFAAEDCNRTCTLEDVFHSWGWKVEGKES